MICGLWRTVAWHTRVSVAFGDDLDLAAFAVADTFGADAVSFAQIEMYHPAVRWRHGLQSDAAARLGDAVGHPISHLPKGVLPAAPVLFNIKRDPDVLIELLAHDALHDKLQRLQGVASTPDEQPGIGPLDVDDRPAGQFIVFRTEVNVNFSPNDVQDPFDRLDRETCRCIRSRARQGFRWGAADSGGLFGLVLGIIGIVVVFSVVFG